MPNMNERNGAIKGRDPASANYMASFAKSEVLEAIIWVEDGKYVPKKSCPSQMSCGQISDEGVTSACIRSGVERINGIVAFGDETKLTVENTQVELSNYGTSDFSSRGCAALATDSSELILRGCELVTRGAGRSATTCTSGATLRVYDSRLSSYGGPLPADYVPVIGPGMMAPPWPLGLDGTARTHLTMDNSRSYFYNCDVYAEAWGAISTDASGGATYLEMNDCRIKVAGNGYGTYADNGCHNYFHRCTFETGNMLAIQDGNSSLTFTDTVAECGGVGLMLHGGLAEWEDTGIIEFTGGSIHSAKPCVLCKSTNVDLYFCGAELSSDEGAVLKSMVTDDEIYYQMASHGDSCYGVQATFEKMEITGDILHEDTERKMHVSFVNASLTGRITGGPRTAFYGSCRWQATGDSEIALADAESALPCIDAPEGVTIHVLPGSGLSGEITLPSGGILRAD